MKPYKKFVNRLLLTEIKKVLVLIGWILELPASLQKKTNLEVIAMKATGVVRKVDELGRIVLPKELRDIFDIHEKDPMEIYVDEEKIILKKYEPSCVFCGEIESTVQFKGKLICSSCLGEARK